MFQLVDEEFDALEGFFYVLEDGVLQLLENVETYLHHLQVGHHICSALFHSSVPQASGCGSAAVPGLQN